MKPHCKPLATALAATLHLAALHAAVPLAWDARPGNPAPASFDRYHGEALEFRCTFRGFGELPFAPGADIRLWYQTNGMGSAWWSAPATIQSNVLSATWSPALDPGADRVSLFFGSPSNAYAAAVLRLRHSPGSVPNSLPLPAPTLDFSTVIITNAPFATFEDLATATNEVLQAANAKRDKTDLGVYSNTVEFTEWVFTPSMYDGHPISMWTNYSAGAWWAPFADGFNIGLGKGDENSLNLSWTEDSEAQINITATRTQVIRTIPVPGKLSTTNDVNSIVESTIADFASTGSVHSANDAYRAVTAGDADTLNGKTAAQIASSATPGNYSTVSNRAMSAIQEHQSLAPSTNYTDAVAAEFESGTRSVRYANYAQNAEESVQAGYVMNSSGSEAFDANALIRESTNAAIAVAARKQDALPYPTNAIPYAAISGAPSGGQEWRVDNQTSYGIHYVTNGMANVEMGAELSCNTNGWCDGAAMFARFTIASGISYEVMDDRVRLVGYGTWPTNNFQSVWWRTGATIYVNILVEE